MEIYGMRCNFEPRQPDETKMNAVKRLLARAGAKEVCLLKPHTPYLALVVLPQGTTEVSLIPLECTGTQV